jgi:hypothetical protein
MEYKMYGLVPYNLSPIQQGIQFGHAVQEMNNELNGWYGEHHLNPDLMFKLQKWATEHKTFIILNGGTTNFNPARLGTLNQHIDTLVNEHKVSVSTFAEPDLGDQITAAVFLVDERVWDKKKYPDPPKEEDYKGRFDDFIHDFNIAVQEMGGSEVYNLRLFLNQFKLA